MSSWMLGLFLTAFLTTAATGIGLWLAPRFRPAGQTWASAWEGRWRLWHGWSLPFFLTAFGMVLRSHVLKGLKLGQNRASGWLTLASFAVLTLTGWALYYAASDRWRAWNSAAHTALGLAILGILLAHALLGYRSRKAVDTHRRAL